MAQAPPRLLTHRGNWQENRLYQMNGVHSVPSSRARNQHTRSVSGLYRSRMWGWLNPGSCFTRILQVYEDEHAIAFLGECFFRVLSVTESAELALSQTSCPSAKATCWSCPSYTTQECELIFRTR